mmetsp:Transcript_67648/g.207220  ORF Transcript_67648/g.207220 Transcript_67648/m.207220 type:complete len:298 (+) Transcript_67648:260-1153(+)
MCAVFCARNRCAASSAFALRKALIVPLTTTKPSSGCGTSSTSAASMSSRRAPSTPISLVTASLTPSTIEYHESEPGVKAEKSKLAIGIAIATLPSLQCLNHHSCSVEFTMKICLCQFQCHGGEDHDGPSRRTSRLNRLWCPRFGSSFAIGASTDAGAGAGAGVGAGADGERRAEAWTPQAIQARGPARGPVVVLAAVALELAEAYLHGKLHRAGVVVQALQRGQRGDCNPNRQLGLLCLDARLALVVLDRRWGQRRRHQRDGRAGRSAGGHGGRGRGAGAAPGGRFRGCQGHDQGFA